MQSQITDWAAALMTSAVGALAMFFAAVPKILGFAIILVVGWLIASLIAKAVVSLLHVAHFNTVADRAGLTAFMRNSGATADPAGVIGEITKWFVRLISLVVAFDALGLPAVSDVLRQVLLWLPNLVVAMVALVIGGVAANAFSNVVKGAALEGGLDRPEFLAKVAKIGVWAFAIVIAVNQIGVATAIVNTLFMATVGAIALALGLSFGLGGRDTAGQIVRKWYGKEQNRQPALEREAGATADRIIERVSGVVESERRHGIADRRNAQRNQSIAR